ncbi:MAG: AMP-binding protein, partial [Rhodospirillales bacterium]|nr:AMP-binding protein [Rhodospirillales bacterium]
PARWLNAIHTYKGTISGAPNFAYDLCTTRIPREDLANLDLSSWRVAFNGAEAISPATLRGFSAHFAPFGFRNDALMPVYGLAENSVGLAFPPLKREPQIDLISRKALQDQGRAVPTLETDGPGAIAVPACGLPLPGHQIRIVDTTGHELGDRRQGRIQFHGPSSTSGYFQNREATQNLFDGQWLNSGDLGYLSEGEVYITGRQKDLIIRAGRNIYPAELETAIGALDGIQQGNVAVFASSDPQTGAERLVVLAESRRWKEGDQTGLKRAIGAISVDLAGTAPDDILLVPPRSVPKTSSGKIRRQAARQLYETSHADAGGTSVYWQRWKLGAVAAFQRSLSYCRQAGVWLYAGYAWLILLLMALPIWTGVALLPSRAVRWSFLRTGFTLMRMLTGIGLTVDGTEKIDPSRPVIFSANHASYIDGAILISVLPSLFSFVVKGELKGHFIPRLFLRRLGCHFVERFDVDKSLADAAHLAKALTTGDSLGYFPEGTFSRMPGLLPFHMGAFTTAVMTGMPIQPIAIRGARAILREGTAFPRRGRIQVKILGAIHPQQESENQWKAALALRDAVRRDLLAHIGEPDLAHERVFHELSTTQKNDHG